jgi:hypothetical protein
MTETLASALVALQAELPHVPKNRTANVPTKNGGSYSYKYADLNDVASAIHPLMSKVGLSFVFAPTTTEDGRFVLRYWLMHSAGERIEGEYPLPDPERNTPQQIGSALTYARRYVLSAVTGVVPDEDDDGQAAQSAEKPKRAERIRKPATPPVDEWTAAPGETPPTPPEARVTDQKWFDGWLERVIACDSLPALKGLWSEATEQHRIGKLTNADFEQATDAKNTQKAAIDRAQGDWPAVAQPGGGAAA